MKKRVLITGGAGFLGPHLCKRLLSEGHYILCLDNSCIGSRDNISHLLTNPRFELSIHDFVNPISLHVDQIYHLACPELLFQYQQNPIKRIETNVMGTINALGIAKRTKSVVLQDSTSEIYANPEIHPQKKSYCELPL